MYQVWTKGDEYSGWSKKDCPDLKTALTEVLATIKAGKEPLLTTEVMFEVDIKVKEAKEVEVKESKAKPGKGARAESDGTVRRGDEGDTPKLD